MEVTDNEILVEVAIVLAIATGLNVTLGPLVSSLIEGIKPTGVIREHWSGVWALVLSMLIGGTFGLLAVVQDGVNEWRYLIYGVVAGLLGPGAGAVHAAQARSGIAVARGERMQLGALGMMTAHLPAPPPQPPTKWEDRTGLALDKPRATDAQAARTPDAPTTVVVEKGAAVK